MYILLARWHLLVLESRAFLASCSSEIAALALLTRNFYFYPSSRSGMRPGTATATCCTRRRVQQHGDVSRAAAPITCCGPAPLAWRPAASVGRNTFLAAAGRAQEGLLQPHGAVRDTCQSLDQLRLEGGINRIRRIEG